MAITSAEFRSSNKILFKAPIVSSAGFGRIGAGDYIDLNSNGKADYTVNGAAFGRNRLSFEEPDLIIPLARLKEAAATGEHGEVLTAAQLGREQIRDVSGAWGPGIYEPANEARSNPRSLDTLLDHYAPLDNNASFAIDLTTSEFLIYRPNA